MTRSILVKGALCALMVPLVSCNLLKTTDNEDTTQGRGAKLHDPYQGLNSGTIRLSLQYFNGCANLGNGQMVKKNTANIPYPTQCPDLLGPDPSMMAEPNGELKLLANTKYFLNQFTVNETNSHNNLNDMGKWLRNQSVFRDLDWTNVGPGPEEWIYTPGFSIVEDTWIRQINFSGANWEKIKDDSFKVEVLDRDGVSRASQVYMRSELLVESRYAGHSRFTWSTENLAPPQFPGDTKDHPVTPKYGAFPQPITYRSIARLDLVGSTNPFKTLTIPADLSGDGALRVTWTQMPEHPFYFPVSFISEQQIPVTCLDDKGASTKCSFGLDPRLTFAPPKDGSFYKPGETVNMYIDLRDSAGNHLHPPDELPSGVEIAHDEANGLLTMIPNIFFNVLERDSISNVSVIGPLQDLQVFGDPNEKRPFVGRDVFPNPVIDDEALQLYIPGEGLTKWPTRQSFKLPADSKPGTYVAFVKWSRYFLGERVSKMNPYFFQVGQDERTSFPNDVGNCQICHKGVLSLDNLRHGLPVDYVEGCKSCHHYSVDGIGRTQEMIHQIHMQSPRYTVAKNDCTVCHLTKRGAIRPSITVCSSCHPSTHDAQYFQTAFSQHGTPNRFSNCAQSCHGDLIPRNHILPE